MKTLTYTLAIPFVLLAACQPKSGDDTAADTNIGDSGDPQDSGTSATIAITGPAEGDTYLGPTLTYSVAGLTLVDDLDGAPVDGQGHVHIKVDGTYVDATPSLSYTFTAEQLTPGQHEVSACLAGNDHTELGPCDTISLLVLNPRITLSSPVSGATLDSRGVLMGFTVSDFLLSPAVGEANVLGQGHYHLMLDGAYFALGTAEADAYFTHLSSGAHELGVELVNNDHSSLTFPVVASVSVTVPTSAPDIRVDSPAITTGYNSATVPLTASVENFTLDEDLSGSMSNMPGMGHYHVYVDGVYTHATGSELDYLLHQGGGDHVVTVVLANYDHTELGARDTMTVNVADTRPDVTITSPPLGETLPTDFNVAVSVENFLLDPDAIGGGSVDGVGHYHVLIDGVYYTLGATGSVAVTGAPSGDHVLRVELVNNDHASHDPIVYDEIAIHVQ